jgi:hypothetical protein
LPLKTRDVLRIWFATATVVVVELVLSPR